MSVRVEVMGNGLVRVEHRASGLVGLYTPRGEFRGGDYRNGARAATLAAAQHYSARGEHDTARDLFSLVGVSYAPTTTTKGN